MATPQNTTSLRFYQAGTVIASAIDAEITFNKEAVDITTKDSGTNSEFMSGLKSGTGSTGGLYAEGELDALYAAYDGTAAVVMKLSTEVLGEEYFSGDAIITSLQINSSGNQQAATFTCQFQFTGAFTKDDNA
jgi:predicted secreted protein